MSFIQKLQEETNNLRVENAVLQKQHVEMENDVRTALSAIKNIFDQLGIDPSKLTNPGDLVKFFPKITFKVVTGQMNWSCLDEVGPFIAKYNHLLPTDPKSLQSPQKQLQ